MAVGFNLSHPTAVVFREHLTPLDLEIIRSIVSSSGFFSADEIEMAVELGQAALNRGSTVSGYHFLLAEMAGRVTGYSCFGPIACTQGSYDLYWIAVHNDLRGCGLGKRLLVKSESIIAKRGGRRIYVETSSRRQYRPTHIFYESCGYKVEAILHQFYSPEDDKIIYVKALQS